LTNDSKEKPEQKSNSDVIIGTILKLATVFNEASRNFQFFSLLQGSPEI
jgi:hypothetical protein